MHNFADFVDICTILLILLIYAQFCWFGWYMHNFADLLDMPNFVGQSRLGPSPPGPSWWWGTSSWWIWCENSDWWSWWRTSPPGSSWWWGTSWWWWKGASITSWWIHDVRILVIMVENIAIFVNVEEANLLKNIMLAVNDGGESRLLNHKSTFC